VCSFQQCNESASGGSPATGGHPTRENNNKQQQHRGREPPAQEKGKPMKTSRSWLATLAVVAALTAAQTGSAQSRYTVTDLGTLPGLDCSFVSGWGGVNSQGHVVGYCTNFTDPNVTDDSSAFLWTGPGGMQMLPQLPGATTTVANAINDLDQVVGGAGPTPTPQAPLGQYVGVLWEGGSATILNQLPGHTDSGASGINNSGIVVGSSLNYNMDPWTSTAVYWNKGKVFPLPPLDGAPFSIAHGVNDSGQIVGASGVIDPQSTRAVLWSASPKAGVMDLGTLGGEQSVAYDINEWGQIAGIAQTVLGDWCPVLWNGMDPVELPVPDHDAVGYAWSLNNCGQIVGFSGSWLSANDIHGLHALLWEDGRMIELQTQIPANSGWKLRKATSINDQGQIAGFGQLNGKMRAFLLTPTVAAQANATAATAPDASAVDAMAANKPQSLWPKGEELGVSASGSTYGFQLGVSWPIAILADHYRVTVKGYSGHKNLFWTRSWSPASYTILDSGRAHWGTVITTSSPVSITVTVTAYSGADEATARAESLNWPPKPGNGPR
jgi:probable HAF family extracellular repeat protein